MEQAPTMEPVAPRSQDQTIFDLSEALFRIVLKYTDSLSGGGSLMDGSRAKYPSTGSQASLQAQVLEISSRQSMKTGLGLTNRF